MTDTSTYPDRGAVEDEWQWLEEIHSEQALAWVAKQNERTIGRLDAAALEETRQRVLDVLDSTDRIPQVTSHGAFLYNFWQDASHPRGLWRRTTLESYRAASPAWNILLDVDDLGRREGVEWVFAGVHLLFPAFDRALIRLSPDQRPVERRKEQV